MKKGLLIICLAVVVFSLLVGCGSQSTPEPTATKQEPTSTKQPEIEVVLVCDECAEIGMEINIWSSQFSGKVIFSVPNRTVVTRIDREYEDGRYWIKIRYQGKTGWILEDFAETR